MTEGRIARIESDMAHVKVCVSGIGTDVREVKGDLKAANDSIAKLANRMNAVDSRLNNRVTKVQGAQTAGTNGIIEAERRLTAAISCLERNLDAKFGELIANLRSMETRIIRWMVFTTISVLGVTFLIARFVLPPIAQPKPPAFGSAMSHPALGLDGATKDRRWPANYAGAPPSENE